MILSKQLKPFKIERICYYTIYDDFIFTCNNIQFDVDFIVCNKEINNMSRLLIIINKHIIEFYEN